MAGFDAELYLRLLGERMLLEGDERNRGPGRPAVAEAAAALIAVGVISDGQARAVLEDYGLASALRDDPQFLRRAVLRRPAPAVPAVEGLKPRRVLLCGQTLELANKVCHVRYASFSADETSLGVTISPLTARAGPGRVPQITLTDDRGTQSTAHFSGSGSHDSLVGRLTTPQPLALDTAWIELDGVRAELGPPAMEPAIALERLPAEDPAARFLWGRLSDPAGFHEPDIEPAVDALLAAGAVAADAPALVEARAVNDALRGAGRGWGRMGPYPPAVPPAQPTVPPGLRPGLPGWTGGPATGAPVPSAPSLPAPWRSFFARRGSGDGPEGDFVLGAVTPLFDGCSAAVLELRSERHGFQAEVEVTPGMMVRVPFDWVVTAPRLSWWARDDLGNHYLGHTGRWSSSEEGSEGIIEFSPSLDPGAAQLDLLPTGETMRAVISIPLPWRSEP